jgi:thiamine biosynthesis lipoprotein
VTDDHRAGPQADGQSVTVIGGGVATSSTTVRRWRRAGRPVHHIVDPATGEPAAPVWRTVSVAAASCVDANTASTAAIVRGASAPQWLESLGLPARLVDPSGRIVTVGAWPVAS